MSVTFVFLLGLCLACGKNIPLNEQQHIDAFLGRNYGTNDINGRNMITVPPNCLPGQALVNGVCRDIWRSNAVTQRSMIDSRNVVTVPTNCPEGQQLVNGVCRDIWRNSAVTPRSFVPKNMVTVPTNCPDGQQLVNGVCRDIWRNSAVTQRSFVPKNMVTVPTNCPDGQQLVNGVCRDIWRNSAVRDEEYLENILRALAQQEYSRSVRQADGGELNISADDLQRMNVDRNIISVPNQCPIGYRPDAFGICREILP